jgi:protein-tyrosine-phosphatase
MTAGALLGLAALAIETGVAGGTPRPSGGHVVFVCAHGNVKSLIAAEWFNRLAADRGMAVRAISRGLSPEGPVPARIAERLRADGFDVSAFSSQTLAREDVRGARCLVMIGSAPPAWVPAEKVVVDAWDGIPPASESYGASRDALKDRIEALLRTLQDRPGP